MEIEIGEYVRLVRSQGINKIVDITEDDLYELDEVIADEWGDETYIIKKEDIVKHSKNIIDLIEEGDYVNGYKVIDFDLTYFNGVDRRKEPKKIGVVVDNGKYKYENYIKQEDIKSIVTKEQFKTVEYEVKI